MKTEKTMMDFVKELIRMRVVLLTVLPVLLAIALALIINEIFPHFHNAVGAIQYHDVNLIIVFCVFVMIATVTQDVDLSKKTKKPSWKFFAVANGLTWTINPLYQFSAAAFFIGFLFHGMVGHPKEYVVGLTLMAFAPCTVMVMIWSFLANGNVLVAYLMTLVDIALIATVYPVMGYLYIGEAFMKVSYLKILYATSAYFVAPSLLGFAIKAFYKKRNQAILSIINVSALTLNVFTLFTLWSARLHTQLGDLALVTVPALTRFFFEVPIFYFVVRKISDRNSAKSAAIIGISDNIELAIVVISVLFGLSSPVFLPVIANILCEIPTQILLVAFFLWSDQRAKSVAPGLAPMPLAAEAE
jgi:ACR3 family arsenite transporter